MKLSKPEQLSILPEFSIWLVLAAIVGILSGTASALFMLSLNWITNFRESHLWIIALLPLSGFAVGLVYHFYGKQVERGNNLILDQIHEPKVIIPIRMTFLILIGTLMTHLFGGSAGREGTAVQMGGSLADQLTLLFKLTPVRRRIILMTGMAAGFGSIFGTPLAGAVFGLEVLSVGKMKYDAILPCFFASIIANAVTHLFGIVHPHLPIGSVPPLTLGILALILISGALFGMVGALFAGLTHRIEHFFEARFNFPPVRPFVGGVLVALAVAAVGTRYIGLGLGPISESFQGFVPSWDFVGKLLFTSLTLGSGFKGGEVTPLFFIGATFGNTLSHWFALPTALLAAMGYVGVFAGAANAPLTCTLAGLEIFGTAPGIYIGLACVVSYLFSGHAGIYSAQKFDGGKLEFL